MKNSSYLYLLVFLCMNFVSAQVGIGTESPASTSILDIQSTTTGVLLPRMTTAQRTAITTPANGLTVFDTDIQSYYFYNATETQWESLSSSRLERDNYVLVKAQSDFPAASAGVITLDENTYYEINGSVVLDTPININGAYVAGLDASEDVLSKASGNVFEGSGGSIRNITIAGGGTAFSITSGASFFIQNTIINGMASVGTISGVGFIFSNNVQYMGNSNGIVYTNITNLLINNQGWEGSNLGTFEKFTGSFDLIGKVSGFSIANGSAVAFDVSANPAVGEALISGTAFSGTSTNYVSKYTGLPAGINFSKNWFVQALGIQDEYDDIATGNIYYTGTLTTGFGMTITDGNAFKLTGATAATNLLRFTSPENNRLTYDGKRKRTFLLNASLSVRGDSNIGSFYSFFIRKITDTTSTTIEETNSIFYVVDTDNVGSVSITGSVELSPGNSIEVWGQRLVIGGGGTTSDIAVFSQNLTIN